MGVASATSHVVSEQHPPQKDVRNIKQSTGAYFMQMHCLSLFTAAVQQHRPGLGTTGIGFASLYFSMEGKKPQFINRYVVKPWSVVCILTLLVTAALSAGCASPPMEDGAASANPWAQDQPWRQADSSVLFTPDALDAMAWVGQSPDDARWYDSRNDHRPAVYAGQATQIVQQRTTTYSHSHLGSSNGRVYDSSYRHTYTRKVEERSR